MGLKRFLSLFIMVCGFFSLGLIKVSAQELSEPSANTQEIYKAEVLEIIEDSEKEVADQLVPYQLLRLNLKSYQENTVEVILEHGGQPMAQFEKLKLSDQVFVSFHVPSSSLDFAETITNQEASIAGYARDQQLTVLFIIFVGLVVIVNGWKGLRSLISLGLSFLVIFKVALPVLLKGVDPSLVVALLSLFIIPLTFYLTHGFVKKTHIAVVATVIALIVSSLLAVTLINTTNLSGLATEEAAFLSFEKQETINLKGLLLAGIILGLLGTLDDVTVTQAGLVFSLKKNKKNIQPKELYQEAMEIGQDHISSMVNTLVLVYTGASLPLLLLFINNPHPFNFVISQDIVVEEIVRTLVSSVGLIFAAPLTTALATVVASWDQFKNKIVVK